MNESREREGIFKKYTEHTDSDGNKTGESRDREGIFGKYTEHTDTDQNITGESRERDGILGEYTEHEDNAGNIVGESRERKGIFGKYIEHVDANGNIIGKSREREGILGKYTEHTGSGFPGSMDTQSSSNGDGWITIIAEFAGKIGGGFGGILGLLYAFDQSYGITGYIISVITGLLVGAAIGSIGVYVLFLGAGLFLLITILRACGADIDTPSLSIPESKPVQNEKLTSLRKKPISGFTTPSRFIVKREYKSFTGKTYKPGDILLVHSYKGEGYFIVEFNGETYEEDLLFSPYGASTGNRCQNDPKQCWGELDRELVTISKPDYL
ncbi:MAG: hypothetical protein KZQ96_20715 [Candidatus Thiodiazotropha sp. (ex Lucinoma borealis)]|nr:hypothetical protein [Candidatus Thiodiazotropha sp. (ex Lucinoma borealis)]